MIKSIRLENYKGFKDTGEIEIRPITLIIGKNSSGKSSLCKLFSILRDALAAPSKQFPLVSSDGVVLARRYENLFHNHQFSGLKIELTYDNVCSLEANYAIFDGNFINTSTELKDHGKMVALEYSPKGDFKKLNRFCKPNIFRPQFLTSKDSKIKVKFIGPIRPQAPDFLKLSDITVNPKSDCEGSSCYNELFSSFVNHTSLLSKVSDWLYYNLDGHTLSIDDSTLANKGYIGLYVKYHDVEVPLSEVGEGITQVLPIITQSFMDCKDTITVLEQPALHLHPAIHSKIAERLALSAKETGQIYVIESHSKNLLLGFQRMVAKLDTGFNPEDIVIYYIDSESSPFEIQKIDILENGSFSDWPPGVFEEGYELQHQILYRE